MKRIFILILFITVLIQIKAQSHSFRAVVWGVGEPIFTFGAWQGALTYERKFTENHALVLDANVILTTGPNEDCDSYSIRYNGSVSYRYYFVSDKKFLNRFYLSPGLKYQKYDLQSCYKEYLSDFYGIRFMLGKQVSAFKRDNWLVDFGAGISYGYRIYSWHRDDNSGFVGDNWVDNIDTTIPDPYLLFIPELIFRIGIRF